MIEPRVRNLHDCILEITVGNEKDRIEATTNLVNIYASEFDKDTLDQYFLFPETFMGDDFSDIEFKQRNRETVYCIGGGDNFISAPQTIADFINDCLRTWKIDLVWENNLIKRLFKI